jgi:hypothetical protein
MPGPLVSVFLGFNRNELRKPGKKHARFGGNVYFNAYWALAERHAKARLPDNVWQEPNTGVVMLRPQILHKGFRENPLHQLGEILLDDLITAQRNVLGVPTSAWTVINQETGEKVFGRPFDGNITWVATSLAIDDIMTKLSPFDGEMKVGWMTKEPLALNEGFAVALTPSGVWSDRAEAYYAIAFGDQWCVNILMNGQMELWEMIKYPELPPPNNFEWVSRDTFNFSHQGINHTRPFMFQCIPWGPSYISFNFSEQAATASGGQFAVGAHSSVKSVSFLVDIRKYGHVPSFNMLQQQWEKVRPHHLFCGIRDTEHAYLDMPYRLRYTADAKFIEEGNDDSLFLTAETLSELRSEAEPLLNLYGVFDQLEASGGQPATLRKKAMGEGNIDGLVNLQGEPFNEASDLVAIPNIEMLASENKVYTPEYWHHVVEFPPVIEESTWPLEDLSTKWNYIRLQKSAGSLASLLEAKFHDDSYYSKLFKRGMPVRIAVKNADESETRAVFDGYLHTVYPTPKGTTSLPNPDLPPTGVNAPRSRLRVQWEAEGFDLWDRLNYTPCVDEIRLRGQSFATIVRDLLEAAGFDPVTEVVIVDSDLNDLIVGDGGEENVPDFYSEDETIGDALREVLGLYAIQGTSLIRIRWKWDDATDRAKWHVYFAPDYVFETYTPEGGDEIEATEINKIFYLDSTIVEKHAGSLRSDLQRWNPDGTTYGTRRHYFATSEGPLEPTVNRPAYTDCKYIAALAAKGDNSAGEVKSDDAAVFTVSSHPDVLDDPASAIYEGAIRAEVVAPPEITATTLLDLQRQGRMLYEQEQRGLITVQFAGEWQPEVDVDDFIAICGRKPTGEPVSYGVFRIEQMDIELRQDRTAAETGTSRSIHWHASYTCVWVGPTNDETFLYPMFSATLPPSEGWPQE